MRQSYSFLILMILAQLLPIAVAIDWGNRIVDSRIQSREIDSRIPIELMGDPIRF